MKVTQVQSPNDIKQAPSTDYKARAVAAFNSAQTGSSQAPSKTSNPSHSIDPNNVSPEELSAIRAPAPQPEEETDKPTIIETPEEESQEKPLPQAAKPEPDPALSRQFAQLARQEKALRAKAQQQQQALQAREEALKAKEAELTAKGNAYNTSYVSKDQIKQDALAVLAEAGVSYEELTQQIMSQQPVDPRLQNTIKRMEAKIQQLEETNSNNQKTYTENQQKAYQDAVKQIALDVRAMVKTDPAYEAIRAMNASKDVVELITETYNKDGILLSNEEAAQQVEDYLVEEALKLDKIEKIKKRREQMNASSAKAQEKTPAKPGQTQPGMKTLTNSTSSTRQLSAKERAILAFRGELQKS